MTQHEWNDKLRELDRRWRAWRNTAFPRGWGGVNLNGVELVLIDADMAMLIESAVNRPPLRSQAAEALLRRLDELRSVLPLIHGDAAGYFRELADMAGEAICLSRARCV